MDRIDKDPENMWCPRPIDDGGARQGGHSKRPASTLAASESSEELKDAVQQIGKLSKHAAANICHKDQVALFVPASTVARLATAAKLMGEGMLGKSVSTLNQGSARAMQT